MGGGTRSTEGGSHDLLIESVDALRDEVRVLRDAIDELRLELQYLVRNPGDRSGAETVERLRVTSLPLDPAADDFDRRVNDVPEGTVAQLRTEVVTAQEEKRGAATKQRGLF